MSSKRRKRKPASRSRPSRLTVQAAMATFGDWLLKIRDEEIWVTTGAESFEDYLVEELSGEVPAHWGLRGERLAQFAATAMTLSEQRRTVDGGSDAGR